PLLLAGLVVLGVAGEPLALAEETQDPLALLAGSASRQALRNGVTDLERRDRSAVAERPGDRVRARGLGGDHQRRASDPACLAHLAKAAGRGDERLADR